METDRIVLRAKCWEKIVNECTNNAINTIQEQCTKTESKSFISSFNKIKSFHYMPNKQDMDTFLSYLIEWKGLNTKLIEKSKQPSSFKQYQKKAKNWANGARARQYSRKLYPHMIKSMEKYVKQLTTVNDIDIDDIDDNIPYQILSKILKYSYLIKLCESPVNIINGKRKVLLLCDNSLKKHKSNTTCKILQSYAKTHEYIDEFPAHREEAIDFYTKQMNTNIKRLFKELNDEIEDKSILKNPSDDIQINDNNEDDSDALKSSPKSNSNSNYKHKHNSSNCSVEIMDVSNQYRTIFDTFRIIPNHIESNIEIIPQLMDYILKNYATSDGKTVVIHQNTMHLINSFIYNLSYQKEHTDGFIGFLTQKVQELEASNQCLLDIKQLNENISSSSSSTTSTVSVNDDDIQSEKEQSPSNISLSDTHSDLHSASRSPLALITMPSLEKIESNINLKSDINLDSNSKDDIDECKIKEPERKRMRYSSPTSSSPDTQSIIWSNQVNESTMDEAKVYEHIDQHHTNYNDTDNYNYSHSLFNNQDKEDKQSKTTIETQSTYSSNEYPLMTETPIPVLNAQMSMPMLPNLRMGSLNSLDWNYNVDPRNLDYESMNEYPSFSVDILHDNSILSKIDDQYDAMDQDIDLY